ncbi:MAG: cytochrome b N-terminal domain-containing protein [Acidobacteriota bacterium]
MKERLASLLAALEERTGALTAWRFLADEKVKGGARWAYVFGSGLVVLLVVQLLSGVVLAGDYAPTTDAAHASLQALSDPERSAWGGLLRSLHHHGATFLVLMLVAHGLQVAFAGAYRKPRETNWWTGLALGGVLLGSAFTGYLLPWDQTAYYATKVGLSILRGVPIIGGPSAELLQGGPGLGNLTLTRFYTLHVVVLPACLLLLFALHLALFRRHGVTPPETLTEDELETQAETFFPAQALKDVVFALVIIGGLYLVSTLWPAHLGPKADPSQPFDARPEWYFYWLFQLLHYFEPPIEWVGSLLIPGLLAGFLVALPFLDRSKTRAIKDRLLPLGSLVMALVGVAVLTLQVFLADADAAKNAEPVAVTKRLEAGSTAAGGTASPDYARAAMLYGRYCLECHDSDGAPIDEDATDLRSENFARMAAADPGHLVEVILSGGEMMPAFDEDMSREDAELIAREILLGFATGSD